MADEKRIPRSRMKRQVEDVDVNVEKRKRMDAETRKQVQELMVSVFKDNRLSNAHKREHDKNRKKLLGIMEEKGLTSPRCTTSFTEKGTKKDFALVAEVSTPKTTVIDTAALRKLVTDGVFMQIVNAAKGKVETVAGTTVSAQCEVTKDGTRNVSVGVAK